MTTQEIRRHLAGEPWCFLPWDIGRLTREDVFELYLQPRDEAGTACEVDGDLVPVNLMSHRQLEYVNSQPPSWLEFERQYQAHMRALAIDAEFRRSHGDVE